MIKIDILLVNRSSIWFKFYIVFFHYNPELVSLPKQSQKSRSIIYKTGLDLWDCLGRVKQIIIAKLHRTDLVIVVILERGKPHLIAK